MALVFYLFASRLGTVHIISRNPAFSALVDFGVSVICGAVCSAGCGINAMLLIIVYVGAVAVLFPFVVMMLDIDFTAGRNGTIPAISLTDR